MPLASIDPKVHGIGLSKLNPDGRVSAISEFKIPVHIELTLEV